MTRRERMERRAERRREWAESRDRKANAAFRGASAIADNIPLGQPILVGHHSEGRMLRDQKRIRSNMDKGCESLAMAKQHRSKASGIEIALDRSVFSDDPDAIERLEERIAEAEAKAARYNEINRLWRKHKNVEALVASGLVDPALAETMVETMRRAPWLKAPLDATSLRASIRRDRKRLEEIRVQRED